MLIDEDIRKYYSLHPNTGCFFKRESLERDIEKLRSVYGDHMMDLLSGMLSDDLENRITPTEAAEFIKLNRE